MIGLTPDQQGFILKCGYMLVGLGIAFALPWLTSKTPRLYCIAVELTYVF